MVHSTAGPCYDVSKSEVYKSNLASCKMSILQSRIDRHYGCLVFTLQIAKQNVKVNRNLNLFLVLQFYDLFLPVFVFTLPLRGLPFFLKKMLQMSHGGSDITNPHGGALRRLQMRH